MSDKEKEDLRDFVDDKFYQQNKKLNSFMTLLISITLAFVGIAVTFMISNARENGTQNTNIYNLEKAIEKNTNQIGKITEVLNILTTNDRLSTEKINNINNDLDKIINKLEKCEFAILTDDPSKITERGISK